MSFKALFFLCWLVLWGAVSCGTSEKNIQKAKSHHQIAIGLISKCDNPRALSQTLKALALHPDDFLIRHTMAVIYYDMGQYRKALGALKKILRQKPDFTEARVGMARAYIALKQPQNALLEIQTAERDLTYADTLKIIKIKALAYYEKGSYKKAKAYLREILSIPDKKDCFPLLMMGKTQLALGQVQKAEELLNQALSVCDNKKRACRGADYATHLALARLYIKKGDKNKALRYLRLFLKKSRDKQQLQQARKLLKDIS